MPAILRFTLFDGLALPQENQKATAANGKVRAVYTRVTGGWFDEYGTDTAPDAYRELTLTATATAATQAALKALLQSYEAKKGVRGTLTRAWFDNSTQTIEARLIELSFDASPEDILKIDVKFTFAVTTDWA